eukprot:90139-Rhodomonas_salina.4
MPLPMLSVLATDDCLRHDPPPQFSNGGLKPPFSKHREDPRFFFSTKATPMPFSCAFASACAASRPLCLLVSWPRSVPSMA